MNSKWQMNRIGLIDFWYYDEEEFYLLDGRLLLRGSNGSGKSVTMQSFIPLLLDGNMRPERLDPFGSRARKMENYLLEEGDERDERTGYLYMEFKRAEAEHYVTIGIGLRARKNKKLETWYFCITDGRRIGKDLFLYRDAQSKITYTKLELKNRIGEGGRVMESQMEYMECVNRLLFGFDTSDQYKELLELLIQLRTPKLSKDFKPTIINDILSGSLQTLSEEDLRPMSEAIENMDTLKTNLDTLKDSVQAAKQMERVYDSYNQIVLYDKADAFMQEIGKRKTCEKAARDYDGRLLACGEELEAVKTRYDMLLQEEEILKAEKQSLDSSDAARLKEQEALLKKEIEEVGLAVEAKETQHREKKDKQLDTERSIQSGRQDNDQKWEEITGRLEEMEELLTDVPFDEFTFMQSELKDQPQEAYDFNSHGKLLSGYRQKVEDGVKILNQEKLQQERYDEQISHMDGLEKERDRSEREANQYRNQLQEMKGELVEKVCQWAKSNEELKLSDETLQKLFRMIEDFDDQSDYSELKEVVRVNKHCLEDQIREWLQTVMEERKAAGAALDEKQAKLLAWEQKKDPEPELSKAMASNRRLLAQKGIPFQQFYKMVDFDRGLEPEKASRLEEALLSMGILDALIIPAEYRSQVLELDWGVSDRYIFSDVDYVKNNVMEILDVDNPDNDLILHQKIAGILCAIGYRREDGQKNTWIDEDGNYRLGILEGTVTKDYEARYIGVRAREAFRKRMLVQLEEEYQELREKKEELDGQVRFLETRLEMLSRELECYPQGVDLKTAARDYADKAAMVERVIVQIAAHQEKLEETGQMLAAIRLLVREICGKVYLTARLDIFHQVLEDLKEYRECLTQVQILHAAYRNGLQNVRNLQQQQEDLDGDLDGILYDLNRLRHSLEEKNKSVKSVEEQLALTNYEEVRERLDYCVDRLLKIPGERESAVEQQTSLRGNLEHMRQAQAANEEERLQRVVRTEWFQKVFTAEYQLDYVERRFVITDDMEDQAKKVCQMLSGSFGTKKQSDLFGNVQEVYHQNRGYLLEYNLTMESLFDEMQEELSSPGAVVKRIDITAKYRGSTVKFKELIERLEMDMQEQADLLSDKDRELFEDILANTISKKIRARIHGSIRWVEKMNALMESMQTSSGLKLSLKWKSRRAEQEEQLDTKALVALLQKDVEIMREEEVESLSRHFRSKIGEARKLSDGSDVSQSFHMIMREVLDYRKWFEFRLEYQKTGEAKKELTDRAFFTFSGGEKAMSMYVPLFSAVVAKYAGARGDAPRIISLDEAFAGVDEMNIKDMFRLMVEFEFNFMINSQILWGDYETVPAIAIYQLIRPENAKFVTVITYVWNGAVRKLVKEIGDQVEG